MTLKCLVFWLQRILRQIRIETHQSERRETDQSGDSRQLSQLVVNASSLLLATARAMCVRARRCQCSSTESARSLPQRLYIPGPVCAQHGARKRRCLVDANDIWVFRSGLWLAACSLYERCREVYWPRPARISLAADISVHPLQAVRTGLPPVRTGVRTELPEELHLPSRECEITASPSCASRHRPISSWRQCDVQQWTTASSQALAPGTVCPTQAVAAHWRRDSFSESKRQRRQQRAS